MWLLDRREWFVIWLGFVLTVACVLEPGKVVLWREGYRTYWIDPAMIGIARPQYLMLRWAIPVATLLAVWQVHSRRQAEHDSQPHREAGATKLPLGWGDDDLTGYFDLSRRNTFASFVHTGERYRKLADVASALDLARNNLHDPEDFNAPFFLFKAHASFLQAANLAMAGSTAESFMVMRGSLESALYGLYVSKNPASMAVWMARHDGAGEMKAVRNTFVVANLWKCLAAIDPALRTAAETLYDKTIDHGAHPNVASMSLATTVVRQDAKTQFSLSYLTDDPLVIQGAMKSVAQVGVVVLDIFQHVFRERFERLGIAQRLPKLREDL